MLKVNLYDAIGKKKESLVLPKEFEVKPNRKLLAQAFHVYEDRTHLGLAKAKTRGEVRISTKKIYKQKGTGGARHGAKSAPIFVGGGVTHGPKGVKRVLNLSKSQRGKALSYALSDIISESKLVFADNLDKLKKTKDAAILVKSILKDNAKSQSGIYVALSDKNSDLTKVFRNIGGLTVVSYRNLNSYLLQLINFLIVDKEILGENIKAEKKEVKPVKIKTAVKTKNVPGKVVAKKAVTKSKAK